MNRHEALLKAIEVLGGPTAMAEKLSKSMNEQVKQNQVSMWNIRSKRLPEKYAFHTELLTDQAGNKVSVKELCPNLLPDQNSYSARLEAS